MLKCFSLIPAALDYRVMETDHFGADRAAAALRSGTALAERLCREREEVGEDEAEVARRGVVKVTRLLGSS